MAGETQIVDRFGRRFPYLRLSLTDVCNFSCSYCLPEGYQKKTGCERFLTPDEFERLVRAFVGLGVWKVRLTGGGAHPSFGFSGNCASNGYNARLAHLGVYHKWLSIGPSCAELLRRWITSGQY